jgi:hypothetical protein
MLFRKTIAVCCKIQKKDTLSLRGESALVSEFSGR